MGLSSYFSKVWGLGKKRALRAVNSLDFSRETLPPNDRGDRLAVGAIVKNEARHIEEWLKFHERAGVDQFYIYDDGSTDDTLQIAQSCLSSAQVTVLPWSQRLRSQSQSVAFNNQVFAYGHCLSNFGKNFRWMTFIDIDEYLVPVSDASIKDALRDLRDVPLIVLPWVMFGTSGHRAKVFGSTVRNYTQRLKPGVKEEVRGVFNFKCIFDPCAVTRLHVHRIKVENSVYAWNDKGEKFLFTAALKPSALSAEKIQLNHYYSRSWEDVEEKISKGGGTYTSRSARDGKLLKERIEFIDKNSMNDTLALDYLARLE